MSKTIKFRLTLDIEFDPADESTSEIASTAKRAIRNAMGSGNFTNGLDEVTVENWSCDVKEIENA